MSDSIGFVNSLINSNSPYLLQHAHNPVHWEPWTEEAFVRAEKENKLVIVSIGYSSCHWCHVMETECFEDVQVADLMNKHYICIKVDREERPDIDQYYIDAANLMHGRVGWPLNVFTLPNKRPVYAGTYFPKDQWMGLLHELASGYKKEPKKYIEYAQKLADGMIAMNALPLSVLKSEFTKDDLNKCYQAFTGQFDHKNGGRGKAPKFPMPDNYLFLLEHAYLTQNIEAQNHVFLTLDKMAKGGIYDQIGGGFARYSVDAKWKVPHFEKMLYDNAQLITLYSQAWKINPSPLYKQVVMDTFNFLQRELSSSQGGYYSALDADSEGEEGKYYVWKAEDFDRLFPKNARIIKKYFGVGGDAFWEHGNNVLLQATPIEKLSSEFNIDLDKVEKIIADAKSQLLEEREKRIHPALDDKVLLSWNSLLIKGLVDAYNAFGEAIFLEAAEKCLGFIGKEMKDGLNLLHAWRKNEAGIPGFLDDYALYIQSLISFYQATFTEMALQDAQWLTERVISDFSDAEQKMFYFTSKNSNELEIRKIETQDNVIASPNAVMAQNLYFLGNFYGKTEWIERSKLMLSQIKEHVIEHTPFYSKWAMLMGYFADGFYEAAILGSDALSYRNEIASKFIPNVLLAGSDNGYTEIPVLENRYKEAQTLIYLCREFSCLRPVKTVEELFKQINAEKEI